MITVDADGQLRTAALVASLPVGLTKWSQWLRVEAFDLGMPRMDGREVAMALKSENPRTPVFMLTGWGDFMKEDSDQPVDAILAKPPRIHEIRSLLREVTPEVKGLAYAKS